MNQIFLLIGHLKLESTVRYLGIEVDDALEIAKQTEVQLEVGYKPWGVAGQGFGLLISPELPV